jgi:hypothetical protein
LVPENICVYGNARCKPFFSIVSCFDINKTQPGMEQEIAKFLDPGVCLGLGEITQLASSIDAQRCQQHPASQVSWKVGLCRFRHVLPQKGFRVVSSKRKKKARS